MTTAGRDIRRIVAVHDHIARIYADDRFPPKRGSLGVDLRLLALTMTWVVSVEKPAKVWKRVYEVAHLDERRFRWTIEQDVPRYEPPSGRSVMGECEAPMIRRAGECGKRGSTSFRVTDLRDGTWRMASFCARHWQYGEDAHATDRARVAAGGIPEPMPNAGGLMPCYISWPSWPDAYAWAAPSRWTPPRAGIRADDWPTMAKVIASEPPRLAVLDGGGQAAGGAPLFTPPSLRLVP